MSWTLKAVMETSARENTKCPIDYLHADGGRKGVVTDQKIENNLMMLDIFDEAMKFKNLIIGRKSQGNIMDFMNLTSVRSDIGRLTLNIDFASSSFFSTSKPKMTFIMMFADMTSVGSVTVGQDTHYCYKISFEQANYYLL